jgi:hypothetical protein
LTAGKLLAGTLDQGLDIEAGTLEQALERAHASGDPLPQARGSGAAWLERHEPDGRLRRIADGWRRDGHDQQRHDQGRAAGAPQAQPDQPETRTDMLLEVQAPHPPDSIEALAGPRRSSARKSLGLIVL